MTYTVSDVDRTVVIRVVGVVRRRTTRRRFGYVSRKKKSDTSDGYFQEVMYQLRAFKNEVLFPRSRKGKRAYYLWSWMWAN